LRPGYRAGNTGLAGTNVLTAAGIGAGDTVAVMDWDSHRYLEAYFAVPMIGAVLHHVNVRLSTDQVGYTMRHAEDSLVLVHDDFLPLVEALAPTLPSVRGYIQLTDAGSAAGTGLEPLGEYEALLAGADPTYDFPDFDENSVATTFYATGTTGKAGRYPVMASVWARSWCVHPGSPRATTWMRKKGPSSGTAAGCTPAMWPRWSRVACCRSGIASRM
jgi:acyl-coenzyme A synthetase/AMP-(fatty) acid ligase